jgi:large subunit ribosomal protein L7Ae
MPKRAGTGKAANAKNKKKQNQKFDKFALQKLRKKKPVPDFVFRFRKPSRRIGSGGVLKKSASLGRLISWPKYVLLQRQRKVLLQRLTVPPSVNIFRNPCSKDFAYRLVKFCKAYSPETPAQKKRRLRRYAKLQNDGKPIPDEKKMVLEYGLNRVTDMIESGRAKLVIIAHDVDPIELVIWMPALCVKKNIPFVIMRAKSRLGALVNKKTASCVAVCTVKASDDADFKLISRKAKQRFNARYNQLKKKWSKRQLGKKTVDRIEKRKRARKEEAKKRREAQQKEQK